LKGIYCEFSRALLSSGFSVLAEASAIAKFALGSRQRWAEHRV
jgi:hypothetical protein